MRLDDSDDVVLVDRGWLAVGASREALPDFATPVDPHVLVGRLNTPYAKPPLWDERYAVSDKSVWQFLALDEFRVQTGLDVLPLVLELAPTQSLEKTSEVALPIVNWQTVNDEWVHKHQAYALQWFSMALVFFIACGVVLIKVQAPSRSLKL